MKVTHQAKLVFLVMVLVYLSQELSAEPANKSPQHAVLDQWVGNWSEAYITRKAKWTPEERRGTAKVTTKWIAGGQVVQANTEHPDKKSTTTILTYDAMREIYRAWWFSSEGYMSETAGSWNPDTKTMTWKARDRGNTTTVTSRMLDADNSEWTVVVEDGAGTVLYRRDGKSTRIKKPIE